MNIYVFPWPLATVMCVLMVCLSFLGAMAIGSRSGLSRVSGENRQLRRAIDEFLAAQDQPPGNWDALDKLREDRLAASRQR